MRRVLFVANWDWVLYNFRLPLATALRRAGNEVILVCPQGRYTSEMRASGFEVIDWPLERRSLNPVREAGAVIRLMKIYHSFKPALIHHFTIKPSVYSLLAVRAVRNFSCPSISTFGGLGYLFSHAFRARVLLKALSPALRFALRKRNHWNVFHTEADLETFLRFGFGSRDRMCLIPGSGVDTRRFRSHPVTNGRVPVIVTGARLLWDKGIADLVEASRILRRDGVHAEFWLAGEQDSGNPSCIPSSTIDAWRREGLIQFLGHESRMDELLSRADIAALPSYHEGVPRFLLESAAAGLSLVATDIDGCRTVVRAGVNGLLVPPHRPDSLAAALATLIANPSLRAAYGKASRAVAETQSEDQVIGQYLRLYENIFRCVNVSGEY
jgi:glycosyltransferase involved in cell wall biosynthesis